MIPEDMEITDETEEQIRKINENAEKIRDQHRNVEIVPMNEEKTNLNQPISDKGEDED